MKTAEETVKATDWFVGHAGTIEHHAGTLKACRAWVAGKEGIPDRANRTNTPGVHEMHDGAYRLMDGADVARREGFEPPVPPTDAERTGLRAKQCHAGVRDGVVYVEWLDKTGTAHIQRGLVDTVGDVDVWIARNVERLTHLHYEYIGREDTP